MLFLKGITSEIFLFLVISHPNILEFINTF